MLKYFEKVFEKKLLEELEKKSRHVSVKAGEKILEIGELVRTMPVVISGIVKVSRTAEDGKEIFLYYVGSNESCAMTFTCCMQHQLSEIKAVAEEDVEMLVVPVEVMDEWLVRYPTWKSFVMKTIHNRFNELLKTIDQIAFQKLDERLEVFERKIHCHRFRVNKSFTRTNRQCPRHQSGCYITSAEKTGKRWETAIIS